MDIHRRQQREPRPFREDGEEHAVAFTLQPEQPDKQGMAGRIPERGTYQRAAIRPLPLQRDCMGRKRG